MNTPNMLLIATTSYAGMGPYVASIVNSFSPDDNVRFFLVEREDKYYSRNIREDLLNNCKIITEKTPSNIKSLCQVVFDFQSYYSKDLISFCKEERIEIVHTLTSLSDIRLTSYLSEHYHLLYTIHDLEPHSADKVFYKKWKQDTIYKRIFKCILKTKNLYTNSLSQYNQLKKTYPGKTSYYSDFPTLITDEIANGNKSVPELKGISNYILFFGRIEAYKGLHILEEAYITSQSIQNRKLVIAGKGEHNFTNNPNIIYINRYIDDEEITVLYKNSACVVYPYTSATQSGVLSVASYYGVPIIASDTPFFQEVLGSSYPYLFKCGSSIQLQQKLEKLFSQNSETLRKFSHNLYEKVYSHANLRAELLSIYHQILYNDI